MGQDHYIDESLRSFLVKLGGHTTEPAGGAALALAAASAAALMSLACHTGMRAGDTAARESLAACQRDSEGLARRIQHLVDEDVLAYREVTRALRAARGTPEERDRRARRLQAALLRATEVPLAVAEAGLEVLDRALEVHDGLAGPVIGDLAAAVHLAEAAVRGSLRNAHINAAAMADQEAAGTVQARITELRSRLEHAVAQIQPVVSHRDATD